MSAGIPCIVMRGGSSKGAYFLARDLPTDPSARDDLLVRIMGSPDPRQIDGLGGAHPLTSKVAVLSPSEDDVADIEYLFLQVSVDETLVSDRQNCGNMLAGVAPFAIERGLVSADRNATSVQVRVRMLNTDSLATATVQVQNGQPVYDGDTAISGVPGTAAEIRLDFDGIAGGSTGALLVTGNVRDTVAGVDCTLIDNGMPVVVMQAASVGVSGYESPAELEENTELRRTLETIRLQAGELMQLGDVTNTTVPKLTMVASPRDGGALCTRTFIPHRCHDAIGVLGAVSVATAALLDGSPASELTQGGDDGIVTLEHPTGSFDAAVALSEQHAQPTIKRAGIIRTARKLMDGTVYPRGT